MGNLDYLEVTQNFKSYYQTLCDVQYYLNSDTEWGKDKIQASSQVISKLVLGFIRVHGTTFREMSSEQYEREFQLFHDDFLTIIENSGEKNVDFNEFASLIDELLGIAIQRMDALGRIYEADYRELTESEETFDFADTPAENALLNVQEVKEVQEVQEIPEVKEVPEVQAVVEPSVIEEVQAAVNAVSNNIAAAMKKEEVVANQTVAVPNHNAEASRPKLMDLGYRANDNDYPFRPRRKRYQ